MNPSAYNFDHLTLRFLDRTDADLRHMRAALTSLREESREVLGEVSRIAHTICGTGAALKLDDVSLAAGNLQTSAKQALAAPQLTTARLEILFAALEELAMATNLSRTTL